MQSIAKIADPVSSFGGCCIEPQWGHTYIQRGIRRAWGALGFLFFLGWCQARGFTHLPGGHWLQLLLLLLMMFFLLSILGARWCTYLHCVGGLAYLSIPFSFLNLLFFFPPPSIFNKKSSRFWDKQCLPKHSKLQDDWVCHPWLHHSSSRVAHPPNCCNQAQTPLERWSDSKHVPLDVGGEKWELIGSTDTRQVRHCVKG